MSSSKAMTGEAGKAGAKGKRKAPRTPKELKQEAQAQGVPEGLIELAMGVAKRTKLWRREKTDVARELLTHFAEAHASGQSESEIRASFGDADTVSRLIRSSMQRKRTPVYQLLHWLGRGLAAALIVIVGTYVVAGLMVWTKRPQVNTPFTGNVNAQILASALSDRAWPLLERAGKLMGPVPQDLVLSLKDDQGALIRNPDGSRDEFAQRPVDQRWAKAKAWVLQQAEALKLVREAAAKPVAGVPLYKLKSGINSGASPYNRPAGMWLDVSQLEVSEGTDELMTTLVPHLMDYRQWTRVLLLDSRVALQDGDLDRYTANVSAMLGLSRQVVKPETLINQLVGHAILSVALTALKEGLPHPKLTAAHLQRLAHELSRTRTQVARLEFDIERTFAHDVLQRAYSDDGKGDGRITAQGLVYLMAMQTATTSIEMSDILEGRRTTVAAYMAVPMLVLASPSREEMQRFFDTTYSEAEERAGALPWTLGEYETLARLEEMKGDRWASLRHLNLYALVPSFERAIATTFTLRYESEGMLAAIAIEAAQRATGAYPKTLAELVPKYLPAVPPDMFTGRPLRYELVGDGANARPKIWSVGIDKVDNGGVQAVDEATRALVQTWKPPSFNASLIASGTANGISGDWVIYAPNAEPDAKAPKQ